MSGRCPVDEIKVRWTLACTEATGVMAARSHYWHLHLVATSDSRCPCSCSSAGFSDGGKERAYEANVHSSRLITEQKAASPGFQRGVVQNKGIRHSITERHPGRHFAALNRLLCVWADRTIFSLGYTSSWGCSADFRTVLWCVQRQPVSCSSHDNAGERTRTAPSIFGLVHFPATASSCEAFDLQASLSLR